MENRVVEMKPVTIEEVRAVLKERKAEKELNYEQEQTMKFVEKFAKLTEKQVETLIKSLKEIEFLKENDETVCEIVNLLPTRVDHVKLLLPKDAQPSEEDLKKIVELTIKFADKIE